MSKIFVINTKHKKLNRELAHSLVSEELPTFPYTDLADTLVVSILEYFENFDKMEEMIDYVLSDEWYKEVDLCDELSVVPNSLSEDLMDGKLDKLNNNQSMWIASMMKLVDMVETHMDSDLAIVGVYDERALKALEKDHKVKKLQILLDDESGNPDISYDITLCLETKDDKSISVSGIADKIKKEIEENFND